jgi:hypothetical protein
MLRVRAAVFQEQAPEALGYRGFSGNLNSLERKKGKFKVGMRQNVNRASPCENTRKPELYYLLIINRLV